tara:strand:- start:1458 stop:1640 length:183 start_codon:yes stop_codon:yes gene_type:complete
LGLAHTDFQRRWELVTEVNDTLYGVARNYMLVENAGDDSLDGYTRADILTGGNGTGISVL